MSLYNPRDKFVHNVCTFINWNDTLFLCAYFLHIQIHGFIEHDHSSNQRIKKGPINISNISIADGDIIDETCKLNYMADGGCGLWVRKNIIFKKQHDNKND